MQSLLRSSPGRTFLYARATHVSHPWLPVRRMRLTLGGAGRNFLRFRDPASRRKPVVWRPA